MYIAYQMGRYIGTLEIVWIQVKDPIPDYKHPTSPTFCPLHPASPRYHRENRPRTLYSHVRVTARVRRLGWKPLDAAARASGHQSRRLVRLAAASTDPAWQTQRLRMAGGMPALRLACRKRWRKRGWAGGGGVREAEYKGGAREATTAATESHPCTKPDRIHDGHRCI